MSINVVERVDDLVKVQNILVSVSDKGGLEQFIPEPPRGTVTDRVMNNIERDCATFARFYTGEQNETTYGTALGLVNTAVEYLDHARGYRNSDTYLGRTILKPEPLKAKAVKIALATTN